MNTKWIFGIVAVAILLGGGYIISRQSVNNKTANQAESGTVMEENENMVDTKDSEMMQNTSTPALASEGMMKEEKIMEQKPGAYIDYSPSALTEAAKNGGKAVLFFWASWCPYCKQADFDFTANTSQIPPGVTVLKTNYDTEKDLKIKFGVTYQHTFVQVDLGGNQITKWNGGGVKELKDNIK